MHRLVRLVLALALAAPLTRASASPAALSPVSTSTREVLQLCPEPGHRVWAVTTGGVLLLNLKSGRVRKWNRFNGLPANEVFSMALIPGGVRAWLPNGTADFSHKTGAWSHLDGKSPPPEPPAIYWRGQEVTNNLEALCVGGKMAGFPGQSRGTHITALIPTQKNLLVGIYGDGFWEFDDQSWRRSTSLGGLPPSAREITCAARDGADGSIIVGTRREGVFYFSRNRWVHANPGDEPYNHNIQAFARYHGTLFGSTLDDGLVARRDRRWIAIRQPSLSTNAPRQMAVFGGSLYVRHGDGYVDRLANGTWARDVFKQLPRRKTLSMATDGKKLFLGQWGGWSEWDGAQWTHHFEVPELQDVALVGLYAGPKALWLMTQSRGVLRRNKLDGKTTLFDARDGLGDDWVTAVCERGDSVYVGTFVGGVSRWNGNRWTNLPALKSQTITALEPRGPDGVAVATRQGLWQIDGESTRQITRPWLDEEVQALWVEKSGLWAGTRTSINWLN